MGLDQALMGLDQALLGLDEASLGLDQASLGLNHALMGPDQFLQRCCDPVQTVLVVSEALLSAALEAVYELRLHKQAVSDLIQLGFEFVHSLPVATPPGKGPRTGFTGFASADTVSPSRKLITLAGLFKCKSFVPRSVDKGIETRGGSMSRVALASSTSRHPWRAVALSHLLPHRRMGARVQRPAAVLRPESSGVEARSGLVSP
jgi:hypothetical protein